MTADARDPRILTTDLQIREFTPKEIALMLSIWQLTRYYDETIQIYSETIETPGFIESAIAKYGDAIYQIPTYSELEAIVRAFLVLSGNLQIATQIAELIQDQHDIEDSKPLAFAEF